VTDESPGDLCLHTPLGPLELVLMATLHGRVDAAELEELAEHDGELERQKSDLEGDEHWSVEGRNAHQGKH